ncbi:MAG TPA: hypothetical protein VNV66_08165 [Pilimelia sp.]|nr:hypothetical protein [Pilimelia sp.]
MVSERYRWDDRSYDKVTGAGLRWPQVIEALRNRPRVRLHLGAMLRIAARDDQGAWVLVTLIEEDDDEYLIVSARTLTEQEAAAAAVMTEGGPR